MTKFFQYILILPAFFLGEIHASGRGQGRSMLRMEDDTTSDKQSDSGFSTHTTGGHEVRDILGLANRAYRSFSLTPPESLTTDPANETAYDVLKHLFKGVHAQMTDLKVEKAQLTAKVEFYQKKSDALEAESSEDEDHSSRASLDEEPMRELQAAHEQKVQKMTAEMEGLRQQLAEAKQKISVDRATTLQEMLAFGESIQSRTSYQPTGYLSEAFSYIQTTLEVREQMLIRDQNAQSRQTIGGAFQKAGASIQSILDASSKDQRRTIASQVADRLNGSIRSLNTEMHTLSSKVTRLEAEARVHRDRLVQQLGALLPRTTVD